ncbi:MAG: SAM-dependent chlorinase/fluorinase [Verrucomicrobiae bacterium]|nr:SAM-dependent chlorinase/fluorinase [Verrucomicrobiae bacterium]
MPKTARQTITLLTDFGTTDAYVGIMKGVIATINPKANVVDLTHAIEPQNVSGAAFVLASAYTYFPKGTIHVAVVDPGVGSNRKIVCMKTARHLFLAPDNGLLTLVADRETPTLVVEVRERKYFLPHVSQTFHGRDVFAPVAAHLSLGLNPTNLGPRLRDLARLDFPRPVRTRNGWRGEVIRVDRFGNLITNIPAAMIAGQKHVTVRIGRKYIHGLRQSYAEAAPHELLAIIGSAGFLEISVNLGSAADTLRVGNGASVHLSCGS